MAFLETLLTKRASSHIIGGDTIWMLGNTLVDVLMTEPDPNTFRGKYYYNASENSLFIKVVRYNMHRMSIAFWKKISD